MKRLLPAALILLTLSLPAHGQSARREALVQRVSALYGAAQKIEADSPLLFETFRSIRNENEGIDEERWHVVRQDVAAAIQGMYTRKGGVFDTLVRGTVVDLSDAELARLAQLLADPAYQKFQGLVASRQGQERMLELMVKAMLASFGEINAVLRRHGLKEIH